MKNRKIKKWIFGLGLFVPSIAFSVIVLNKHFQKKQILSKLDKINLLNKITLSISSQTKTPFLTSDYFGTDVDVQKQKFVNKFKGYLRNNYNSTKFNINEIISWIDFSNIRIIKLQDDNQFFKLCNFRIKIKYSTQRIGINFCFYRSLKKGAKSTDILLNGIKKEIVNQGGIYKLTSFKKVAFPLVKKLSELQTSVNKATNKLQGTSKVDIKMNLDKLADSFNKLNKRKTFFEHNLSQYENYQRVYFKNNIGVFLLSVKDSSGKAVKAKFAIYDYISKRELIGPTTIDDFDGGKSKHFKIQNNNLFYTVQPVKTNPNKDESLYFIDLSSTALIKKPKLIAKAYNVEMIANYSGNADIVVVRINKLLKVFDVKPNQFIFSIAKYGYDNLLFRISQDKKTFYLNDVDIANSDQNTINKYTFNSSTFNPSTQELLYKWNKQKIKKTWRMRSFKTFAQAFINDKLVKNVSLAHLAEYSSSGKEIMVIYEENNQLIRNRISVPGGTTNDIVKKSNFYFNDSNKILDKKGGFIYISTSANNVTLEQKSTAISNQLAFQKAKQKLMDLIIQSFVNYQKRIQKWFKDKYFILYDGMKSETKSFIQLKIDEDKIKASLLKSLNNYDFSKIVVKDSDEIYDLDLKFENLTNFMAFTYTDIVGNKSKEKKIDLKNDLKDANGNFVTEYKLRLYKDWENIYNRVNKTIQNNLNNPDAFDHQKNKPNTLINLTKEDYYRTFIKAIKNNLQKVIDEDIKSNSKSSLNTTSYRFYFRLNINGTYIDIYSNSSVDTIFQKIISVEKSNQSLFKDMILQSLKKLKPNFKLNIIGEFIFDFKGASKHKQTFSTNQSVSLTKVINNQKLSYHFGNASTVTIMAKNKNALLYVHDSQIISAPSGKTSVSKPPLAVNLKEYYIYDIEHDKKVKVNNSVNKIPQKKAWWHFSYVDETSFKLYYEENNKEIKEIINNKKSNYIGTFKKRSGNGILMWGNGTNQKYNTLLDVKEGKWNPLSANESLLIYKFDYTSISSFVLEAKCSPSKKQMESIIRFKNGINYELLGFIKETSNEGILLYDPIKNHNSIYDKKRKEWKQISSIKIELKAHRFIYKGNWKLELAAEYHKNSSRPRSFVIFDKKGINDYITYGEIQKTSNNGILLYDQFHGYCNSIYDISNGAWESLSKWTSSFGGHKKGELVIKAKLDIYNFDYNNMSSLVLDAKYKNSIIRFKDGLSEEKYFTLGTKTGHTSGDGILLYDNSFYNSIYDTKKHIWARLSQDGNGSYHIKNKLEPYYFKYANNLTQAQDGDPSLAGRKKTIQVSKMAGFQLDAKNLNNIVRFKGGIQEANYQTLGAITSGKSGDGILLYDKTFYNSIYDTKKHIWARLSQDLNGDYIIKKQLEPYYFKYANNLQPHQDVDATVAGRNKLMGLEKLSNFQLDAKRPGSGKGSFVRFEGGIDESKYNTLGHVKAISGDGILMYRKKYKNGIYDKKTHIFHPLFHYAGNITFAITNEIKMLWFNYRSDTDFMLVAENKGNVIRLWNGFHDRELKTLGIYKGSKTTTDGKGTKAIIYTKKQRMFVDVFSKDYEPILDWFIKKSSRQNMGFVKYIVIDWRTKIEKVWIKNKTLNLLFCIYNFKSKTLEKSTLSTSLTDR